MWIKLRTNLKHVVEQITIDMDDNDKWVENYQTWHWRVSKIVDKMEGKAGSKKKK